MIRLIFRYVPHSVTFCFCVVANLAQAQTLSFWRDSILTNFSAEEIASLKNTIRETLEQSPDTKTIQWKSPSSDLAGKILPKLSFESNGQTCRRTAFQVTEGKDKGNGRKEQYRFDICKNDDEWGIVAPAFDFSKAEQTQLEDFLAHVLESEEDNFPNVWKSNQSENSVVIVPFQKTKNSEGQTCRDAAAVLTTPADNTVRGKYNFCKIGGQWSYQPK